MLGVCVCVFFPFTFWKSSSLDEPAGVAQEEGHTGFFIYLPSAVCALTFLARRIQPFLSLVDREVEFLCTNNLIVLHSLGFFFFFLSEKNTIYRDRTHIPTCQKGYEVTSELPGRPVSTYQVLYSRSPSPRRFSW